MTDKDKPAETPPEAEKVAPLKSETPAPALPPSAPPTPEEPKETAPTPDPVAIKLSELGIGGDDIVLGVKNLGAETVDDLTGLSEVDLTALGVPVLKARKAVATLKSSVAAAAVPGVGAPAAAMSFESLPAVPDDESWLNALRSGGVRKVEQSTVISAIRAALADRFGMYDIPKKLVGAMEDFVEVTEEQVGEEFWALRKQLTRKSFGDLFQAIDGLDGTFVTDKRKSDLLGRINDSLWPSIISFNEQLAGWQEAWMGSANPAMMGMAMAAAMAGGSGAPMPPGMMQPPDCGILRDAAEAVNDSLNRTFRGTGVQISAALAYEANQIKAILENSRLPLLCGVPSRDLLLKKLKVSVPATYPRMEQNLTRFALGIMQTEKVAAGNEELQYFGTLFMLGSQIPWGDLERTAPATKGKRPGGIGRKNDPFNVDD